MGTVCSYAGADQEHGGKRLPGSRCYFRAQELDHQLRFYYFRWDLQGKKELRRNGDYYNVSPWNLIYDDEKYYLVGYDHLHKEIRHYRVDKILDVEEVDLKRKGVTKFRQVKKAKYTQQHFRMYGGEIQTVTLLCENEMSNVIVDQFGRDIQMIPVDENYFIVDVEVAVSSQFFGWIVGIGGGVKLIGPEEVKEKMQPLLGEL